MRPRALLALLAAAAFLVPAAGASADELVVAAPGAAKLAGDGGYLVWAAPNEDTGWHLVVRAPDGTVAVPAIRDFAGPPQVSVGSDAYAAGRALLAVYSRPSGGDDDLYALDLRTGREHRVSPISSSAYDEDAPSVQYGQWTFVRRGGKHPGVYVWHGHGSSQRLTSYTAHETINNASRVAYPATRTVVVRRLSGQGKALVFPAPSRPRSVQLSRYRTTWLGDAGEVRQTPRFAGSGGPYDVHDAVPADRALSASASGIAMGRLDTPGWFLDGAGLNRVTPPLSFAQPG